GGERPDGAERQGGRGQYAAGVVAQALGFPYPVRFAQVVARLDDAAAERAAPGGAVDPGHGVAAAVGGHGERGQQRVQVGGAPGGDVQQGAADGQQPQGGGQDDAGQAHAADGGPEGGGLAGGREAAHGAGAVHELHGVQPGGYRAVAVLVRAWPQSRGTYLRISTGSGT